MTKLTVHTQEKGLPVAPDLYGLFFEDINRAGDSGLYPEMLRNRSFEDSLVPERCEASPDRAFFRTPNGHREPFANGEGSASWLDGVRPTDIPAWYAQGAEMMLDQEDVLNPRRLAALKVTFSQGGWIENCGYRGVPAIEGQSCRFYAFAHTAEDPVTLVIALVGTDGSVLAQKEITVLPGSYTRYDGELTPSATDTDATLRLTAKEAGIVTFGFASLMPAETYKGHGMRKDLMEMLEGTKSHFLRFPGGCIVEGFTYETAMRFSDIIGPVWERPSKWNLWHYRSTNGLGYHEYLQICEDLGLEALYVVNCGMTCQGRAPEFFEGEGLQGMLQEAFDAVDYATAPVGTKWGDARAAAGHPEPFGLKYIEIGNENDGPLYFERYKYFYDELKNRYPWLLTISNSHTEREGLPTEIVDEHYYRDYQFFAQSGHLYDHYDRKGPKVFLGEYAVTRGVNVGTLQSALAETMFLLGVEKNPDIVTLTAYAPLFENVYYRSWSPNLIVYDNHQVYGIPFCHALGMLGGNRGRVTVPADLSTDTLYPYKYGLPGFISYEQGVRIRNPIRNGKAITPSKLMTGRLVEDVQGWTTSDEGNENIRNVTRYPIQLHMTNVQFGGYKTHDTDYSIEVFVDKSTPKFAVTVWTHNTGEPGFMGVSDRLSNFSETEHYAWTVEGGEGRANYLYRYQEHALSEAVKLPLRMGQFNTFRIVTDDTGFDCYLNGEHIQRVQDRSFGKITAMTTQDEGEIQIKLVNFTAQAEPVGVELDCAVEDDYEADVLSGPPEAKNSFAAPTAVAPRTVKKKGASSSFMYDAPAWSFSVLRLKKK